MSPRRPRPSLPWRKRQLMNSPPTHLMDIQVLHHVAVNVRDLERSRQFYREVLGLSEVPRPDFPFPGIWFRLAGEQRLHLIVHPGVGATFRGEKGIDTRDLHFAVRVRSYRETVEFLRSKGYSEDAAELDPKRMTLQPH